MKDRNLKIITTLILAMLLSMGAVAIYGKLKQSENKEYYQR